MSIQGVLAQYADTLLNSGSGHLVTFILYFLQGQFIIMRKQTTPHIKYINDINGHLSIDLLKARHPKDRFS